MLYDVTFRLVAEDLANLVQGENSYRIIASMLVQGIYTLQLKQQMGVMASLRFVKE